MIGDRKRFYRDAAIAAGDAGFAITLDGRPVRTPAGTLLHLPTAALAEAIVAEWQAQTLLIRPATMPLTALAATAIDRVRPARQAVVSDLVGYGLSDLVCYRATSPAELAALQHRLWQPLVDWIAARHGVTLSITWGVMPVEQPAGIGDGFARAFAGFNDLELTAVAALVQGLASAVIGLAVAAGRLDVADAVVAADVDGSYQRQRWGGDAEAEARQRQLALDMISADRFLGLARGAGGLIRDGLAAAGSAAEGG